MSFFRTFGKGANLQEAFKYAISMEKDIHTDLAINLKKIKPVLVPNPLKKEDYDIELLFLITDITLSANRELTSSEIKNKNLFYDYFSGVKNKKRAELYLDYFQNKNNIKKCIAIEIKRLRTDTSKSYRFIGTSDYKFLDCD